MKVVIHAGIHRTGTTSLQLFLSGNREPLLARGIAYPGDARNHQPLAWSLFRHPGDPGEVRSIIESHGTADIVVLSAEDFCIQTDLRWLKKIAGVYDTHVVFYLRRQDHWIMSWYNQHVKWPFDRRKSKMDKTEFLEHSGDFHWLDYEALLHRWTAVLGGGNVSAAVVEKGQVEDVVEDFVVRFNIPHADLDLEVKRVNDSLPVHMLEIARQLEIFDLTPKARVQLIRALRLGLADKTPPHKTIYSPQERHGIIQRFELSNKAVAKRVFKRDSLFLEPPPAFDDPFYSFPEISRQEFMREWIAPVLKELLPKA